jgi:hypothetical protein
MFTQISNCFNQMLLLRESNVDASTLQITNLMS